MHFEKRLTFAWQIGFALKIAEPGGTRFHPASKTRPKFALATSRPPNVAMSAGHSQVPPGLWPAAQ